MRKFKGLMLGILCFFLLIAVTGCGNKTALSSEDFKTKMEDKGFMVQDATTQMEQYSYINKVYLAISSDSSY